MTAKVTQGNTPDLFGFCCFGGGVSQFWNKLKIRYNDNLKDIGFDCCGIVVHRFRRYARQSLHENTQNIIRLVFGICSQIRISFRFVTYRTNHTFFSVSVLGEQISQNR